MAAYYYLFSRAARMLTRPRDPAEEAALGGNKIEDERLPDREKSSTSRATCRYPSCHHPSDGQSQPHSARAKLLRAHLASVLPAGIKMGDVARELCYLLSLRSPPGSIAIAHR